MMSKRVKELALEIQKQAGREAVKTSRLMGLVIILVVFVSLAADLVVPFGSGIYGEQYDVERHQ